jgi:hypothetical protein
MLLTLALLPACREITTPDGGPSAAYRGFVAATGQGDFRTAWNALSKETQAELTRESAAVAQLRGLPPPEDGLRVAFGERVPPPRELKSIAVTSEQNGRATLLVTDDAGGEDVIQLTREGERWKIDLTAALQKAHSR